MMEIRKSEDRGHANHGWLDSHHTFSFAEYYDPKQMGVSVLRVINEDRIQGGMGFGTHGHQDMEIISYVVEGALEHKDSMGSSEVLKPGEVQRMSAGTGVKHSEFNHLKDMTTHFLQIWIIPDVKGLEPSYEQKRFFSNEFTCHDLILVASKSGRNGSLLVHQDVDMWAAKAQEDGEKNLKTYTHRHIWVQAIKGDLSVMGTQLNPGDGAHLTDVENVKLEWKRGAEFLVFDLP